MAHPSFPKPKFFDVSGSDADTTEITACTAPVAGAANPQELLTRKQVEEEYGLSVKILERFAWAGGGPPMVKFGHRTVRYRRGDIEAFITAHVVPSAR